MNNKESCPVLKIPKIMGIINCTPDSFFADSRKLNIDSALKQALNMEEQGVDIIDIGGESSRPGADYVSAEQEIQRVIPLIKAIRKQSHIPISLDTRKSETARAAFNEGINMINDISALRDDPKLGPLCAEKNVPVVLMHMQGNPGNMQKAPKYQNIIQEISQFLEAATRRAMDFGIKKENIILDPGIGFGKSLEDNLKILGNLPLFHSPGFPLLIGLSRKSFLGKILDNQAEDRLAGSLAAQLFCALQGADFLRVHDVKETIDILKVFSLLQKYKLPRKNRFML